MKRKAIALGRASRLTRDFSGANWWDNLTFSFKAIHI
jgi:hypothetical protein